MKWGITNTSEEKKNEQCDKNKVIIICGQRGHVGVQGMHIHTNKR